MLFWDFGFEKNLGQKSFDQEMPVRISIGSENLFNFEIKHNATLYKKDFLDNLYYLNIFQIVFDLFRTFLMVVVENITIARVHCIPNSNKKSRNMCLMS